MNKPLDIAIIGDLNAEDDYPHEIQLASNFSESNLFYYAGKTTSGKIVGGIIRVANKPNEGYAEATILFFPGDGSAFFKFERPEISGNASWKVSGWDLNVVTPGGVEFGSAYNGETFHLSDPHLLADPKRAFQEPVRELALDLTHLGKSPLVEFRYNRDTNTREMQDIADTKGLHQLTSFSGSIAIDRQASEAVNGYGWRDHNWGPRNWQAFPRHAFYTGNFDQECGFVLFQTEGGKGYFMHEGPDKIYEVADLNMATKYKEDDLEPESMRAEITLDNGATHVVEGELIDFIPLRNRRDNMTTRLGYSLWNYQLDGKREGLGIAEHMSQSKD